jgi:hypothetical protein
MPTQKFAFNNITRDLTLDLNYLRKTDAWLYEKMASWVPPSAGRASTAWEPSEYKNFYLDPKIRCLSLTPPPHARTHTSSFNPFVQASERFITVQYTLFSWSSKIRFSFIVNSAFQILVCTKRVGCQTLCSICRSCSDSSLLGDPAAVRGHFGVDSGISGLRAAVPPRHHPHLAPRYNQGPSRVTLQPTVLLLYLYIQISPCVL